MNNSLETKHKGGGTDNMAKDYIDLEDKAKGKNKALEQIRFDFKQLKDRKENEAAKEFQPFCRQCATFDFDERFNGFITQLNEARYNIKLKAETVFGIDKIDWDSYKGEKHFKLLQQEKFKQKERGSNKQYISEIIESYQCKRKNYGFEVCIPMDEFFTIHGEEETRKILGKDLRLIEGTILEGAMSTKAKK